MTRLAPDSRRASLSKTGGLRLCQYQPPKRRGGRKALIWILSILVLLVALDFGARAFAESEAATQIQKQGFPKKPNVSIAGFTLLTQIITRNFQQITITSSNIPAGPVKITSLDVMVLWHGNNAATARVPRLHGADQATAIAAASSGANVFVTG